MQSSKRKIGLISATALGVSSIIGSGWLFAPYHAAVAAGPAAVFSWILAAIIITLLGLCFAEIASLYPRGGLSAVIPSLSHNKHFAFPFAISNWLGVVAVISLESDATIQYLINLTPTLKPLLYQKNELTLTGNAFSVVLVLVFYFANYWGISGLAKTNNIFAAIKVAVPIIIVAAVMFSSFHLSNFSYVGDSVAPHGVKSIFTAILNTGIIVAFNGFQAVIAFAGEIKRPSRTIPLSIVIAIILCLSVYAFLQIAFIGGIPQNLLENGWEGIEFNAPVLELMGLVGLGSSFAFIAYLGATLSPIGCGMAFTGTASRMFTAMAHNEQMPEFFSKLHPVYGISRSSLLANTVLAVMFLLIFRSWSNLAQLLSLLHIVSYLPVPIAVWVLRGKISNEKYPFRLPYGKLISVLIFIFFTYLFTLSTFSIVGNLMILFAVFLGIFIIVTIRSVREIPKLIEKMWSLLLYFLLLTLLTAFSTSNSDLFNEGQFFALSCIVSILCFFCLLKTSRNDVEIIESTVSIYGRRVYRKS